jgi:serine/threonine-protein kinase
MALKPGTQVGVYEIVAPIGAGGMGEVYRATDTKLKRDVAIKVLPDDLIGDSERLTRLEREAQVLASLNHPHIASIYGLEESGGVPCLILELVEGQTLAEMLVAGSLPVERALEIAKQIALALEAAHEKGVIHRDLKPANIKITSAGLVKVLDFGLAKALADESAEVSGDPSQSPTLTAATRAGVILGTAAYMSPEQARGKRVDQRTDIWSFGCVLYEMLTGRRAFTGETVTDTLAAVIGSEPDWSLLPAAAPRPVRRCLERCLRKDPRQRLRHIADARLELDDVGVKDERHGEGVPSVPSRLPWFVTSIAIALAAVFAGLAWYQWTIPAGPKERVVQFSIVPQAVPAGFRINSLALAPDDRLLAYSLTGAADDRIRIYDIESGLTTLLDGSNGADHVVFSPDGGSIAFWAGRETFRMELDGGRPERIAKADEIYSMSWAPDGSIVFAEVAVGIRRVHPQTGEIDQLTQPTGSSIHSSPMIVPDNGGLLFTHSKGGGRNVSLEFLSAKDGSQSVVLEGGAESQLIGSRYLAYMRNGRLEVAPFDRPRARVSDGISLSGPIQQKNALYWLFSVTNRGSLAYVPAASSKTALGILDRTGAVHRLEIESGFIRSPRVSPDGRRLTASLDEGGYYSLWLFDMDRATLRRLTDDAGEEWWHTWIDEHRLVFQSTRRTGDLLDLYILDVDGTKGIEPLLESTDCPLQPQDWVPRTQELIYTRACLGDATVGIWGLNLDDREPRMILTSKAMEMHPSVSPDGRWLVYTSNASGEEQVFVTSFPEPDRIVQVSPGRGRAPKWMSEGREIVYETEHNYVVVPFTANPDPTIGPPRPIYDNVLEASRPWGRGYDVFPDGERLLLKIPAGESSPSLEIRVVLNWRLEVERALESR